MVDVVARVSQIYSNANSSYPDDTKEQRSLLQVCNAIVMYFYSRKDALNTYAAYIQLSNKPDNKPDICQQHDVQPFANRDIPRSMPGDQ